MVIDLIKLRSGHLKNILLHENLTFQKEDLKGTELLDLKDVWVDGNVYLDAAGKVECHIKICGTMHLPCSITLKEIEYPFETQVEGSVEALLEEIGENQKNMENTIDIFPIIWENILMEIPMKVVSEDAKYEKLKGDGWKLITEDEEKEVINPEFAKLKDLL